MLLWLKIFKHNWHIKTPKRKWKFIYNGADMLCELIGVRVYSDMENYWFTYSAGAVFIFHSMLMAYTIQYYAKQSQILKGMECTCSIGIAITVG